jgi:YfiH family protein
MSPLLRIGSGLAGPTLFGGLTTRIGFSPRDGDEAASRRRLRDELAAALGRSSQDMAWCTQVHGARVLEVVSPGAQGEADALFSRTGTPLLLVSVADCCPILLWDGAGQATAVAHAGWRGLVAGVAAATVAALSRAGAPPQRLRCWLGPSIGVEHFEVGEEVAARFHPQFVRRDEAKPHVDLKAAAVAQLASAGVAPQNIEVCPDDTFGRSELYWSYRRDRGICGRHLGYLLRS